MVIQPFEANPTYTNLLVESASLYLRQHAHNPVFWHPWGPEALARAVAQDKPIFLSVGYSSCYWCHVMEREIFENVSIAAQMNRLFINIKVDREEQPEIDDIYMIARQLLKGEGGWPNNVFLTPDLQPFYAGGTYAAEETDRRPSFPRLLEWIDYVWRTQRRQTMNVAGKLTQDMQSYLVYTPVPGATETTTPAQNDYLFALFKKHYDNSSGGFFQAPKFPHECYLQFLLGYYETTGKAEALDIVHNSLSKMAAGGIQDHVGCGFHRYAVDKEWYIPHFEKMLYTQAQMARTYTDAARTSGNPYFADIAKSILDFVGGPMTSGNGGFYASIDAETDGVEGEHYAWSAEQLQAFLTAEELTLLTSFYALADIPQFPGHKHVDGQVLILRKSLDVTALERGIPYVQLAAMVGQLMNKLLEIRSKRKAPMIDNKILVGWNGLMIDAFAYAGRVFNRPSYTARAREAVDFLLEHAVDNAGNLRRVFAGGTHHFDATLDDYAFLIKGIISLRKATDEDDLLAAAIYFCAQVEDRFGHAEHGYYFTQNSDTMLFRLKTGDDSAIPNSNAVMAHNLLDMYDLTKDEQYRTKARALIAFFTQGNTSISVEYATMMQAALRLSTPLAPLKNIHYEEAAKYSSKVITDDAVTIQCALTPSEPERGTTYVMRVTLTIKEGWHINTNPAKHSFLIPTQIDVQGEGVKMLAVHYPDPLPGGLQGETRLMEHYEGEITISLQLQMPEIPVRPALKVMVRYQPCHGTTCHQVRDMVVEL